MQMNLTLLLICGALVGCGVYLLLERSLSRVLIGLVLIGNGVNLAFLASGGPAGESAFYGSADPADMSDPLPQALVLTAIVITLATVSFLLAMAHRSWQLHGNDDVQDDVEDAAIRRLADDDATSDSFDVATSGQEEDDFEEEST
jgi:multicomponent Na+:H+ antiporter subunit C